MLLHIKIFFCLIICNNHVPDFKLSLQGDLSKGVKCKLLLKDKKGKVAKRYCVKSFLICVKKTDKTDGRFDCSTNAGDVITDDFKSNVLSQLPHGNYQILIKNIICGPILENNTDINHFRIKDFELEIQL